MIRTRPTSVARPPGDDALGRRTREPGAHQFDHLRDGEAVREHDRFGAAVARRGEQFKRGAAVGLWAATRGGEVGHGVVAAVLGRCPKDIRRSERPHGYALDRAIGRPGIAVAAIAKRVSAASSARASMVAPG